MTMVPTPGEAPESRAAPRILVVEDDWTSREYLRVVLGKGGCGVEVADGVGVARSLLIRDGFDAFDCVVTDFRMPGESGLDLLAWLQEEAPDLGAILLSAESDLGQAEAAWRDRGVEFLLKPVDVHRLRESVTSAAERTRQRRGRRPPAEGSGDGVERGGTGRRGLAALDSGREEPGSGGAIDAIPDSDSPAVMLWIDPLDGRVLGANPAAALLYGWPVSALRGRRAWEIEVSSEAAVRGWLAEVVREGGRRRDARHRLASGVVREVEVYASRWRRGESRAVQWIVHDVTEWRQAADRERQTAARLRLLWHAVEQSPASIVITDPRGAIQYVNPKFTEVTGYTSGEAIGQNPRILKAEATPSDLYRDLWATLSSGRNWRGEFCNRRKDGRLFWESALIAPVKDDAGNIINFLAIKEDITARKQAEEDLRSTNQQLEDATARANAMALRAELANVAKSEFLANLSHEIRTPMNGILGMTGLLLDTPLTPEQRQYAELLRNGGQILLSLINDILDFSKIEAGRMELETLDFDLRQVVEDAVENLAVKAASNGIELVGRIAPEVPVGLRGDPARLCQILLNLGGNAVKFTKRGEVVMRVVLERAGDTDVTLRFTVSDTGVGIPPERRHLIFSPFGQTEASNARRFGGTGLGLAISRQLAERMGGTMGFESEEGRGTTFWFTAVFGRSASSAPPPRRRRLEGRRVLVVEDHAASREAMADLLAVLGCRFTVVEDRQAALAAWKAGVDGRDPYDVVLVDRAIEGLPPAGGGDAGRGGGPGAPAARWIRLHALGGRDDEATLVADGFSGSLAKPCRLSQLEACLDPWPSPLAVGAGGGEGGTGRPRLRPIEGLRVLVADDHPTNQFLATTLIRKLGGRVDVVNHGGEAIEALRRDAYDLVLMDCRMPEMDGLEATRRIREGEAGTQNATIPILALTASATPKDREESRQAGMDDFLTKPIQRERLAAALCSWGGRRSGVTASARGDAADMASAGNSATPGSQPAGGDAVFDVDDLVGRMDGDTQLAKSLVTVFRRDLEIQMSALREAVDQGDCGGTVEGAHCLKGAAAAIGGVKVRDEAGELERLAKAGETWGMTESLGRLDVSAAALAQALDRFLGG